MVVVCHRLYIPAVTPTPPLQVVAVADGSVRGSVLGELAPDDWPEIPDAWEGDRARPSQLQDPHPMHGLKHWLCLL